jgi:hypothetical protein
MGLALFAPDRCPGTAVAALDRRGLAAKSIYFGFGRLILCKEINGAAALSVFCVV